MEIRGGRITGVTPGGIGEELGLEPGDTITRLNGSELTDMLVYQFECAGENLEVEVYKKDGTLWLFDVEKDFDEGLGIEFEGTVFDGEKTCANRCVFCFIHQMPPGMRDSLYVKDDDYRLSFWHGNFVTLTNIPDKDLKRIVEMRLSPLYVSVHTTNPELRREMMGNRRAGEILKQLAQLVEAGIEVHAQVVLCPGVNDGQELERTLHDLDSLGPYLRSVGVVPVGLTGFREGLAELRPFTPAEAGELVASVARRQKDFRSQRGTSFVYLADEFYLLAGKVIPLAKNYDGFPQIENGIGLIRLFSDSFARNLRTIKKDSVKSREKVSLATGTAAAPVLQELMVRLDQGFPEVVVYPVENRFFQGQVNVAGLLTGADLLRTLKGQDLGEKLFLPSVMVKCDEPVFLDGMSVEELSALLDVEIEIIPVEEGAKPFLEAILR